MSRKKKSESPKRSAQREPSPPARSAIPGKKNSVLMQNIGRPISPSHMRAITTPSNANRFDKVKKNAKGGVLISIEEISAAFQMMDIDNTGLITLPNLKKRIGILFPDMTAKEYRFLMNNKKEISINDIKDLLLDNEITNFDPVAEAFKVFDINSEGSISGDKLREAFISFGLGELSDEELDILTRSADLDNDGVISLEDFRALVDPITATNARKSMTSISEDERKRIKEHLGVLSFTNCFSSHTLSHTKIYCILNSIRLVCRYSKSRLFFIKNIEFYNEKHLNM